VADIQWQIAAEWLETTYSISNDTKDDLLILKWGTPMHPWGTQMHPS